MAFDWTDSRWCNFTRITFICLHNEIKQQTLSDQQTNWKLSWPNNQSLTWCFCLAASLSWWHLATTRFCFCTVLIWLSMMVFSFLLTSFSMFTSWFTVSVAIVFSSFAVEISTEFPRVDDDDDCAFPDEGSEMGEVSLEWGKADKRKIPSLESSERAEKHRKRSFIVLMFARASLEMKIKKSSQHFYYIFNWQWLRLFFITRRFALTTIV